MFELLLLPSKQNAKYKENKYQSLCSSTFTIQ
jgi:hypothetical protein